MTEGNSRYRFGGLLELDDAYFGGVSQSPGRSLRMAPASEVAERIRPGNRRRQPHGRTPSAVCGFRGGAGPQRPDREIGTGTKGGKERGVADERRPGIYCAQFNVFVFGSKLSC
jgi:hypothetical protein